MSQTRTDDASYDRLTRVDVLDVPLSAGSFDAAVKEVATWVRDDKPSFAIFRDVHGVMQSQRDKRVLAAHHQAGLVACDGMPMVWASRWAGVHGAERVRGCDFVLAFCARAEQEGWSIFFYGSRPRVTSLLVKSLLKSFPRLRIAGTLSPPFRPLSPPEDAEIIETIRSSGADVVCVGLSTPKQELWMAEHVGRVGAPALLGVGAAFDFLAGEVREAPTWIRQSGFEWLFRMVMEPRRLAGRYLRNNPAFIAGVVRHPPRRISRARGDSQVDRRSLNET
jgi:N-acetylglucosaminyldiphosphoundecaprenol N-acetyl-beta-D-mannosaminyltransferase